MLTNEAIEVPLSYLRPAVEAIQAELPALRHEIRALDEKLSGRIDALDKRLTDKFDGKINALDSRLTDKFDKLTERVMEMQGNQKGLILFLTTCALLVSGVSVAHTLSWI